MLEDNSQYELEVYLFEFQIEDKSPSLKSKLKKSIKMVANK